MTTTQQAEMDRRISEGLDPMTGKPWALCDYGTIRSTKDGCVHVTCGRKVTLDEDGNWAYAD